MKSIRTIHATARLALAAASACGAMQAHAAVAGSWGEGCDVQAPAVGCSDAKESRSFVIRASDGHASMGDGVHVYMWGYGLGQAGRMQYTGPTLLARAGEHIMITLYNDLPVTTSMTFPGQVMTSGGPTATSPLGRQIPPGEHETYEFTAGQPGTYTYQSGTRPSLQVEMGLMGALIVYPATTLRQAYDHPSTAFDRETLLISTDIDSDIHQSVYEQVQNCGSNCDSAITVDLSKRFPKYWTLNGRTSPDVFANNYVGELPHQPYNALPRLHPGEKILFRMIGGGMDMHPMHHHGANSWHIATDGRMLSTTPDNQTAAGAGADMAVSDYTIPVTPGQTYDAIWSWSGKGLGWDVFGATCDLAQAVSADNCRFGKYDGSGTQTAAPATYIDPDTLLAKPYRSTQDPLTDMYKPIPSVIPSELELAFGEFYSGSPYLGDFGARPVGAGAANTTGGFFHMFHSHNEREVVNGGIYPGGMLTMTVIEPFTVKIDPDQP